jgi:RNA polymerase sigma-70 factor (ECF subfamily)
MRAEEFVAFCEKRRERALRLAFRLLGGDQATAEDVVQNAFLRAHRALERFRGDASLDTWFYRILVNEVQRQRRWSALRRLFGADPESAPPPVDPRPTRDPGLRRRIGAALERLSAGQREAFVDCVRQGRPAQEGSRGSVPTILSMPIPEWCSQHCRLVTRVIQHAD